MAQAKGRLAANRTLNQTTRASKKQRKARLHSRTAHAQLQISRTSLWTPRSSVGTTRQWAFACAHGLETMLTYVQSQEPWTLYNPDHTLACSPHGYQHASYANALLPEHLFSIDQISHAPIVVVQTRLPQALELQSAKQMPDQRHTSSLDAVQLLDPLSARELDVLHCLAAGLSNQQIAQQLIIAESTVKWHLKQIYGKLVAGSRTQAIAHACACKLIP